MVISYVTIRKAVGYIAISFAPVLALGTVLLGNCPGMRDSVSAYYYTCMGSYFIGALCAVALFLFTYKGFDTQDQIVTNAAALFALGVVFFPTDESTTDTLCNVLHRLPNGFFNTAHYISAGIFFVLMAYMSLFLFTKTNPGIKPTRQKLQRNVVYKVCGYVMLVAMAGIPCLKMLDKSSPFFKYHPEFWMESTVLIAFGISWLVKGLGSDKEINREKTSRYILPFRLSEVISLISVLSIKKNAFMDEDDIQASLRSTPRSVKTGLWQDIIKDHPEFFRPNFGSTYFAIVIRSFFPEIQDPEFPEDSSKKLRRPLDVIETQNLINVAVSLHQKEIERHQRNGFIIPVIASLITLIGALTSAAIIFFTSNHAASATTQKIDSLRGTIQRIELKINQNMKTEPKINNKPPSLQGKSTTSH